MSDSELQTAITIYAAITLSLFVTLLLGVFYVTFRLLTGTRSQFALLMVLLTGFTAIFIIVETSL